MNTPSSAITVHKQTLVKPDGRHLILYGRQQIQVADAPSPSTERTANHSHFRWHPFRAEWVAYAAHRQHRTFLPPEEYNPLSPTSDPESPTEMPEGIYDVGVFENRFSTMRPDAKEDVPHPLVRTRAGTGTCEVVVFTQDANSSLGALPLDHLEVMLEALADRYRELGSQADIQYVMPFENRGAEVGVTLHHPHGQIYAFPFVPPVAELELRQQAQFYREHGRGLLSSHIINELHDGRRILYSGAEVVAFVPAFARYAYEVWIAPHRSAPSLAALSARERRDLARALKTVLLKYDGLWGRPFPYIMVVHQAPTDGAAHPEAHCHIEFYSAYRMPDRLKFLAGCELGAGMFTSDTLPEAKAAELQAVQVHIDD